MCVLWKMSSLGAANVDIQCQKMAFFITNTQHTDMNPT